MIRINLLARRTADQGQDEGGAGARDAAGRAPGLPAAGAASRAAPLVLCAGALVAAVGQAHASSTREIAAAEKRQRELQAIKAQVDAFQQKKRDPPAQGAT